ncbi:MAG TPA: NADH-quinone oxidoreductase subunit NuoG [Burkholderiaceae bacterium]|nr:NADH-quinone oxidoreductase subunit NuoG [Burkholderiaceae bacterium]
MVEVTIDGQTVEVPAGSMLMDAASKLDIYVPHFCYHKKLSIAANCRMCLVDVEKAPKPLPACATPVTQGMVVHTQSKKAKAAQQGVMEFLLINHPLDCPICDQGGECQLQDLAVGYGAVQSSYDLPKRVVFHKNLGPLIAAEVMTRCIQCTRCVRFGQEVAGVMELGMGGRGEHAEILAFVDRTVDSEVSGNMIDLCPVGALTSKPFRYAARTWELSRRKSVSLHDSLGAHVVVQIKDGQVKRVVPFENEAVNECWISDRDRFSYEGLYAADRLQRPMIKQNGQWQEVDWETALAYVQHALGDVQAKHGAASVGALAGPTSTLEEMHLLARLVRALGSENIDFRLRQSDFSADSKRQGAPWLGMLLAEVNQLDRLLLVGSFLRKDHPLLSLRVRHAAKQGCQVNVLHAADDDLLMPVANKVIAAPDQWVGILAEIAAAVAQIKQVQAPISAVTPSEQAQAIARSLVNEGKVALWLGNAAAQHPQAAQLHALVQWIAQTCKASFGLTSESATSISGYVAGATPGAGGLNAKTMFEQPLRAYLLWNLEPEYDCANPAQALAALKNADTVIACSPYRNGAMEYADVILPIATFFESSGTSINCEGRVLSFNGTVQPVGQARPGWKVLRVLGNAMELSGFDHDSPESVRAQALPPDVSGVLSNTIDVVPRLPSVNPVLAQRVADVPLYFSDAIVRRAVPLQKTADAKAPKAIANEATLAQFGVSAGDKVRVIQKVLSGEVAALLECAVDEKLPQGVVRVAAGHAATSTLGSMFGEIRLERA